MPHSNQTLIIVPTYNEGANIESLVSKLLQFEPSANLLIVDDNSPDGTGNTISKIASKDQRVHLLMRSGPRSFAKAYIDGFSWALQNGYSRIVQMDADLSHDPADVPRLLEKLSSSDVVIGSRYIKGGGVSGWQYYRKVLSRGGNIYARLWLGVPYRDLTGGFIAQKIEVLKSIPYKTIHSDGYSFLIELKFLMHRAGFKISEVPIHFENRRQGSSKLSSNIIVEAAFGVPLIRFKRR